MGRFLSNRAVPLILIAGLLLAAAPVRADGTRFLNGSYVSVGGGVVGLDDAQLDYGGAFPNGNISYDAGWGVSGAVGSRVLDLYRLELEISHRENDVYATDLGYTTGGSMKATTYMVNGYFDVPFYVRYSGVVPYVGLGVGRAQFSHNIQLYGGTLSDSSSHAFAYQVIAGLEVPLIPRRMSTTIDFRYLSATPPLFRDTGGFYYHSDYDSYTLMVGLRWGF